MMVALKEAVDVLARTPPRLGIEDDRDLGAVVGLAQVLGDGARTANTFGLEDAAERNPLLDLALKCIGQYGRDLARGNAEVGPLNGVDAKDHAGHRTELCRSLC